MPEYKRHGEGTFSSLTKQQKEAVGLLSIGTLLEYFDLMLYVHMAVLLNDLFFPTADPHTSSLYSALAFCSTYVLRPFGALVFGWIGDNIGRKSTVVITTLMMSFSCIVMANLPTYAQIGITATYIMCLCRVMQGLSAQGEMIGAQLYLTEFIKPPARYTIVALIVSISSLGGMLALAIASLVTMQGLNWRIAFWVGAIIAVVGAIARTALRETPEFADAKRRIKKVFDNFGQDPSSLNSNCMYNEAVKKKTALSYFLIHCSSPVSFYLAFIHCPQILKHTYFYTPAQIIQQNLFVSIVTTFISILLAMISYKIYPLKILRFKLYYSIVLALVTPYMLYYSNNSSSVLFIQLAFASWLWVGTSPAHPIFLKHFPVFKRFTYSSIIFALSRVIMYVTISFGTVYLVEYFNYWGLYIITIPVIAGFWFALSHFTKLEQEEED